MKQLKTNLRFHITALVLITLVALAALVIYAERYIEFKKLGDQHINDLVKSSRFISDHLEHKAETFSKTSDWICQNAEIRRAFLRGDYRKLSKLAEKQFTILNSIQDLSCLTFYQTDKTSFLQVHNPSCPGDKAERKTLAKAESMGKPAYGIELDSIGRLSFRYVRPWYADSQLIGFVELGKELGTLTEELNATLGFDFAIAVDKWRVDRDAWLKNLKTPYRTCQWDFLDDAVIIDHTFIKVPDTLAGVLENCIKTNFYYPKSLYTIDGEKRMIGGFPLTDVNGIEIGRIFLIQNMTVAAMTIVQSSLFFGIMILVTGFFGAVYSYFHIGRTEKCLEETNRLQKIEILHRRFAEAQLTEAKELAEAAYDELKRAEQKHTLHVNQTPLGVIQWSNDFRVEAWNPAAEVIFGYSAEEAIGRTANELIVPEDIRVSIDQVRNHLLTATESSTNQNENITRDGVRIMCKWNNTPLVDDSGKVIGVTSIVEDITLKQQHDQELKKEKERAETANQAKSRFLANMTHELRTPMNAILGFSELLKEEDLTVEQKDYIDTIYLSSRHLLSLINDILDISKIEAGKEQIAMGVCSLRGLLGELSDLVRNNARVKGLEFVLDIKSNVPEQVVTDGKHLYQCLLNLISNAIKFTDTGSVVLHVGLMANTGTSTILFEVGDTGIGIPEDRQEKVFESFEQADSSTNRKYGGTGLGLAITRQLIEMMGGTISLESEQGVGSIFSITLPVEVVSQTAVF